MGLKKENYPIYLFTFAILSSIVPFIIQLIRNRDYIFDPLLDRDPDTLFWGYMAIIVLGTFMMFRLVQYYQQTQSTDYLLIAYFVFGVGVSFFLWQSWIDYYSPILGEIFSGNSDSIFPGLTFGRQGYFWGLTALLFSAIRTREWSSYNRGSKVFLSLLLFESVATALRELLRDLLISFGKLDLFFDENPWYLRFTIMLLLFPSWTYNIVIQILAPIAIIYAYATLKPEIHSKEIKFSRYGWIMVGTIQLAFGLLSTYNYSNLTGGGDEGPLEEWATEYFAYTWSIIISLIILMILLFYLPEALLISSYQITKACKLYAYVHTSDPGTKSEFWGFDRLRNYINEIPEEVFQGCAAE